MDRRRRSALIDERQDEGRRARLAHAQSDRVVDAVRLAVRERLRELRSEYSDLDVYQRRSLADPELRRLARQFLSAELAADFLIEAGAVVHDGRWVLPAKLAAS